VGHIAIESFPERDTQFGLPETTFWVKSLYISWCVFPLARVLASHASRLCLVALSFPPASLLLIRMVFPTIFGGLFLRVDFSPTSFLLLRVVFLSAVSFLLLRAVFLFVFCLLIRTFFPLVFCMLIRRPSPIRFLMLISYRFPHGLSLVDSSSRSTCLLPVDSRLSHTRSILVDFASVFPIVSFSLTRTSFRPSASCLCVSSFHRFSCC